jgi:hypothetical protein
MVINSNIVYTFALEIIRIIRIWYGLSYFSSNVADILFIEENRFVWAL